TENGRFVVYILLIHDVPGFSTAVRETLGLLDFPIQQLVTGSIVLTVRPSRGGESIGEGKPHGESGTFGCLVEDSAGDPFILSCHHVLAQLNAGTKGVDPVWQPSFKDGGTAKDQIGV